MSNPHANAAAVTAANKTTREISAWSAEVAATVKPPRPYARPAAEILADLSKPIVPHHLREKVVDKKSGRKVPFIPWHIAVRYLDFFAPGWCSEIRNIYSIDGQLIIAVRLSIPTAEGWIWREATGSKEDDEEAQHKMYGSPADSAEASALKRAAAKFGLGLYLYDK